VVGGTALHHDLHELSGAETPFPGPPATPTGTQVVIEPEELRSDRIDVVLDGTGASAPAPATDARVLRVAPELSELPALDVTERVARLYALLYPDDGQDGAAR
jgi:hypothetical protein